MRDESGLDRRGHAANYRDKGPWFCPVPLNIAQVLLLDEIPSPPAKHPLVLAFGRTAGDSKWKEERKIEPAAYPSPAAEIACATWIICHSTAVVAERFTTAFKDR